MKLCTACMTEKTNEEFNKNSSKHDGLQTKCRDCQKIWYDNYYRSNPKELTRITLNNVAHRLELREYVDKLKSAPCTDCKRIYPPWAMDFDHIGSDKILNISNGVQRGISFAKIISEIAKCELVCANCHRTRTHNRIIELQK
jgi:hypothetical protein